MIFPKDYYCCLYYWGFSFCKKKSVDMLRTDIYLEKPDYLKLWKLNGYAVGNHQVSLVLRLWHFLLFPFAFTQSTAWVEIFEQSSFHLLLCTRLCSRLMWLNVRVYTSRGSYACPLLNIPFICLHVVCLSVFQPCHKLFPVFLIKIHIVHWKM